jgi:hypothetical protein
MSADATTPDRPLPSREEQLVDRAEAHAAEAIARAKHVAKELWHFGRFLLFTLYLILGVVAVWLWIIESVFGVLRFFLRSVMIVLLWLAGGIAPRPGPPPASVAEAVTRDLKYFWAGRVHTYERFAQTAAGHYVAARRSTRTFWHWPVSRKLFALSVAFVAFGIPLLFVIPRPNYVQVTDDNAVHYEDKGQVVMYLVHATDLFDKSKTHEYRNEDAVYLGKVNSQGLKAQLVPGRYYRFWVVGIRWYKYPRLFPNIIWATEVDAQGNTVLNPSRQLSTGAVAPSQGDK